MASTLITILNNLETQLKKIDGTTQPKGYTYHSVVTTINQEDESVVDDLGSYPYINIYLNDKIKMVKKEQRHITSNAEIKLVIGVANTTESEQPQFAINEKVSDIINDVIFNLMEDDATLGRTVFSIDIGDAKIEYTTVNEMYRAANVVMNLNIHYKQSISNPDTYI